MDLSCKRQSIIPANRYAVSQAYVLPPPPRSRRHPPHQLFRAANLGGLLSLFLCVCLYV